MKDLFDGNDKNTTYFQLCPHIPTPAELGWNRECDEQSAYVGGETAALAHLQKRLKIEENAFRYFEKYDLLVGFTFKPFTQDSFCVYLDIVELKWFLFFAPGNIFLYGLDYAV